MAFLISLFKKSNVISDSIIVLFVLVFFAIVVIVVYAVYTDINQDFQDDPDIAPEAKTSGAEQHARYPSMFDGAYLFAFMLLWVALIGFSFMVDTHPFWLVLTVILLIFVLVGAAYLSNFFQETVQDPDLSAAADEHPNIIWIGSHLVEIILGLAASGAIALFAKNKYYG